MRRQSILMAGLASIVIGNAADAQVSYKAPTADPLAIAVMSDFARCVADTDPAGAHRVLDADYHAPGYNAFVRTFSIAHKSCLHGGQLRFNQILLIGGMAEEFNRKAGLTPERLAALSAADTATSTERCLIRREPVAVRALFSTMPASQTESAAIDALRSGYAACLPEDRTPVINPVSLRSRLAIAVYRLAATPAAAG